MDKMKISSLFDFQFLSALATRKDQIYYVKTKMDEQENTYHSSIYRQKLGEEPYLLTSGPKDQSFILLENGDLLFSRAQEEKTTWMRLPQQGGEAREEFSIDYPLTGLEEVQPGAYLMMCSFDREEALMDLLEEEEKERKKQEQVEVITEIPFLLNGKGLINQKRNRLAYYSSDQGLSFLTADDEEVDFFSLNESKSKALFIREKVQGKRGLVNELVELDLETGQQQVLSTGLDHAYAAYGSQAIFILASDHAHYGLNENQSLYLLQAGERRRVRQGISSWNSVGSDLRFAGGKTREVHEDRLYLISTQGHEAILQALDMEGNSEILLKKESIDSFSFLGEDLVFVGMTEGRAQEIYLLKDGQEERLTEHNPIFYQQAPLKEVAFDYKGHHHIGFLKYPLAYEKGKKYPAILSVHGGPKTVYGRVLHHEMEVFAAHGYFVLFMNPHGSDGQGDDFADIRGKYGTIDVDDLLAFTDHCLDLEKDIDGNNLFMTGGSYGGFMANWLLTHTDRFRAICTERSIVNWFTEFGLTDIGYYFVPDQMGIDPWQDPEKLWDFSPLKDIEKAKTPTLIIHSTADYRCSMAEGLQLFTALKYFGVEAKLLLFHGETHELSRSGQPLHRKRRLTEILDFFDEHQERKE